jgi:mycofactocin system FadH/OYE family oxidoreductase 1
MKLLEPVALGGRTAHNRVLFGPLVTNLADDERRFTDRHRAFYERRAAGGCGIIVLEEAAVHPSDWPYERSPLADRCADGWSAVGRAVHQHDAVVLAGLGHTGGQGSSAYSQRELWAPSRVPDVASREVPKWMEPDDIAAVVAGFGASARIAAEAGLDGVEINIGQHSLIRQFLSGLTNHRGDEWGTDRLRLARDVIAAVRAGLGKGPVLAIRLSCDEMAPWAGVTPEAAAGIVAELGPLVDLVTVVRGSIFTTQATRPDFHDPAGFNVDLCRAMKAAAPTTPVALQGSIVDPGQAEWALADSVCDVVEMTRAQLADAALVRRVQHGQAPRPCLRCNQTCQVRDARNPVVTCVVDPFTGHELDDEPVGDAAAHRRRVLVVGAGPAGLECARVLALRGHHVRVAERRTAAGGHARFGPGGPIIEWLLEECRRHDVHLEFGVEVGDDTGGADIVVWCTGSRPGEATYTVGRDAAVVDVTTALDDPGSLGARVTIWDPIGGPIAVALAEQLGSRATLVTPDQIAGNELSRSGDLAPANVRLAQRAVTVERRSVVRAVHPDRVTVSDRFTGVERDLPTDTFVDAGFRLPEPGGYRAGEPRHRQAGDAVAPRTIHEAILEGRRVALSLP